MVRTEAAQLWCQKMSQAQYGTWRCLFVQQRSFERALAAGVRSFAGLVDAVESSNANPVLQ